MVLKFIASEEDPHQLYDLGRDPDELVNLAEGCQQERRVAAFEAEMRARWDPPALRDAVLASQRTRRLVADALLQGRRTPWDHQPFRDAARRFVRIGPDLDDLEASARVPRVPEPVAAADD